MLFNPTLDWGWLYLGYNTLGKNWMSVSFDDDVDAVERNQIRPQRRFAAELFMNFVLFPRKVDFTPWLSFLLFKKDLLNSLKRTVVSVLLQFRFEWQITFRHHNLSKIISNMFCLLINLIKL